MRHSLRRVLIGFAVLGSAILGGTAGYVILAGAPVLDALFMVVITIFSVGYEETIPADTPLLKVYTIVFIVTGCSALLYIVGGLIQMGTEGELNRALGARRMTRGIESLRNHTVICGFGRMGQILAQELLSADSSFVVIERNDERRTLAEQMGCLVLDADATTEEALIEAQVGRARCLATVLPVDADNVFITLSARNLNPTLKIYARGELPSTEPKLRQAGANHVVLPATIGGIRMAHLIVRPDATRLLSSLGNLETMNADLEQVGLHLSDLAVYENSPLIGKTVKDIEIEGTGAHLVVAIRRHDGKLITKPPADTSIEASDTIIVVGHGTTVPRMALEPAAAHKVYAPPSDSADKP